MWLRTTATQERQQWCLLTGPVCQAALEQCGRVRHHDVPMRLWDLGAAARLCSGGGATAAAPRGHSAKDYARYVCVAHQPLSPA